MDALVDPLFWLVLALWYLLIVVPALFLLALALAAFALFVPGKRLVSRSADFIFLGLTLIHLLVYLVFIGAQNPPPAHGFDLFLIISLYLSPPLFLLAALLQRQR